MSTYCVVSVDTAGAEQFVRGGFPNATMAAIWALDNGRSYFGRLRIKAEERRLRKQRRVS